MGAEFAARAALYKAAMSDAQRLWTQVPRKQFLCRYHPETSSATPELRLANLRCPVESGAKFCQSVDGGHFFSMMARALTYGLDACQIYAHRLFECPWQYVPNSSLTDPTGCWRPSTGFK